MNVRADTRLPRPPAVPPPIHTAVGHHSRTTPDAVALVRGPARISYAELDAASEAWAAALRERGAGPGGFVPVLLPRSAKLVTVLLAVLKTGAAYAALDPGWPAGRIHRLLGMLRPRVTVAPGAPAGWSGPVWTPPSHDVRRAAELSATRPDPPAEPGGPTGPAAPATVFFTSGTTGDPKAVVSGHGATTSLFGGGFEPFPSAPVMPQAAPVSWDAFTMETWGPLTNGGTCVLLDGDYLLPGTLRALADRDGVDTVWLTASLFNLFTDEDPGCFRGLRHVLTGGERLSVPRVRAFLDRHPGTALTNGYGPVETCVFATARRIERPDCDLPSGIPLGHPVPGRQVHVLADGRPAEPGRVGEICVSGDGVALGYLGDPALTARRFPTLVLDGRRTRVHRTGDLGFQDPDGLLHFTGRSDRQVKIRGHRVAPEEVEAFTRALPGVGDCAVVPVRGQSGAYERTALFYTCDGTAGAPDLPQPRTVRRALAAGLPRHLVPDLVHRRDGLPLTAGGKLDRAALAGSLRSHDTTEGDA
ncbi:chemotaxis protein CheR [Streptomyces carminius]|uniref:Chemotaxis protein CheR n=1 Tax=Streptomyces carminius TaxID=2665496 RepID=A0A2M8LQF7_9ACTN|nr:amino acid adenylation domain-containing protein [Streptomyces carminius]PJE94191.1 chemotaxis protein CheR [Streptomyces carminius]